MQFLCGFSNLTVNRAFLFEKLVNIEKVERLNGFVAFYLVSVKFELSPFH